MSTKALRSVLDSLQPEQAQEAREELDAIERAAPVVADSFSGPRRCSPEERLKAVGLMKRIAEEER